MQLRRYPVATAEASVNSDVTRGWRVIGGNGTATNWFIVLQCQGL